MLKTIIDKNGYIVDRNVCVDDNNNILYSDILLEEGQQVVEYLNKEMLKPQWNGSEWIETATQEELNEAYPVLTTPVLSLEERVAMLENLQLQQEGVI